MRPGQIRSVSPNGRGAETGDDLFLTVVVTARIYCKRPRGCGLIIMHCGSIVTAVYIYRMSDPTFVRPKLSSVGKDFSNLNQPEFQDSKYHVERGTVKLIEIYRN